LLLAADVYSSADANIDRVFDDWRTGSDRDEDGFEGLDEISLEEGASSLDAVWRERAAVDAVFGNLRELQIRPEERKCNTSEERTATNETSHRQRDDEHPPAEAAQATYPLQDVADGGMVLLMPTGDANLGIDDSIGDIVGNVERANHLPVGVEASIGIYQAMDVGAADAPNANGASAAATRSAESRPNLTSENAVDKRSEQPS
jgi:hypothetical protein